MVYISSVTEYHKTQRSKNYVAKVHEIWGACRRVPADRQISFRLLIPCSVAKIRLVKVQSQSQKKCFPQPVAGKCPEEYGPFFSKSSHKWICVQVWLRSVQWPQRLAVIRKKTTGVIYMPFCIAMPCRLIKYTKGSQTLLYYCSLYFLLLECRAYHRFFHCTPPLHMVRILVMNKTLRAGKKTSSSAIADKPSRRAASRLTEKIVANRA